MIDRVFAVVAMMRVTPDRYFLNLMSPDPATEMAGMVHGLIHGDLLRADLNYFYCQFGLYPILMSGKVPSEAPTAFIKPRWKPLVITPQGR